MRLYRFPGEFYLRDGDLRGQWIDLDHLLGVSPPTTLGADLAVPLDMAFLDERLYVVFYLPDLEQGAKNRDRLQREVVDPLLAAWQGIAYTPPLEQWSDRLRRHDDGKCPDNLPPDGPRCPRCGEERGPSGVDGGSWVHMPKRTTKGGAS